MVAYQEITSGDRGLNVAKFSLSKVTACRSGFKFMTFYWSVNEGGTKSDFSIINISD